MNKKMSFASFAFIIISYSLTVQVVVVGKKVVENIDAVLYT